MKVIVSVRLKNGMDLPVTHEIETLADLKKLGEKLAALPAGANKLIPGLADAIVEGFGVKKEQAAAAA
jgi:hypothetical protein